MIYPQIPQQIKDEIINLIISSNSILITSHKNPDDDSVGSTLSTYFYLKEKYPQKKVEMGYTGEINNRWSYFENFNQIRSKIDIAKYADNFDLIIFLDGGQFHRFTEEEEKLKKTGAKTVCIDHHSSPHNQFTSSLIINTAASTSELVYLLFFQNAKNIPRALAETLLLGIIGDTGSFQYIKPNQSYVFDIAKRLIEEGDIEIQELMSKYSTYSYTTFQIIKELINTSKIYEIKGWPKFTVSHITRRFIAKNKYSYLDAQEAVAIFRGSFSNSIEGISWSLVLYPKENGDVSLSLRSLPKSVNVRDLVERMDIGGGHDRAAGGLFETENGKSLETLQCISELLNWLKKNKPVIS